MASGTAVAPSGVVEIPAHNANKNPGAKAGVVIFRSSIFSIVVFVVMLLDCDYFVFVIATVVIIPIPVAIMITTFHTHRGCADDDFLGLSRAADDRRSDECRGSEQTKSNKRKENFPHHTLLGFLSLRLESKRARRAMVPYSASADLEGWPDGRCLMAAEPGASFSTSDDKPMMKSTRMIRANSSLIMSNVPSLNNDLMQSGANRSTL
jgi:hypothetical protein